MKTKLFVLTILTFLLKTEAAKILAVFPTPSISHQVVFRPFTAELVRMGHEVTVITADPAYPNGNAPNNLNEIDVHNISYGIHRREYRNAYIEKPSDIIKISQFIMNTMNKVLDVQFRNHDIKSLREKSFDLLIIEAWLRPLLIWSHFHKVPVIQISSLGGIFDNYINVGGFTHPLDNSGVSDYKVFGLSHLDQIISLYNNAIINNFHKSLEDIENEMLKDIFGKDLPELRELAGNVDLLLLNLNIMWDMRGVPKNVVYLGGLHQKPEKELPKDLKSYLDNSKNGVIYVSFGTNVIHSVLPSNKVQMFINVLSHVPYDVLWSWNRDELPGKGDNIKVSKWLPQSDILKHPKIKLFITQGGLQSTDEAITAGVPMIGIPILGDQWLNVDNYVHHGIGVKLVLMTMDEEQLRNAIGTVIGNHSYRSNIIKLRSQILDTPTSALQRAIWWSSHLLRHRTASHVRPTVTSLAQYLELELLAIVAVCVFTVMSIVCSILYYAVKMLLRKIK